VVNGKVNVGAVSQAGRRCSGPSSGPSAAPGRGTPLAAGSTPAVPADVIFAREAQPSWVTPPAVNPPVVLADFNLQLEALFVEMARASKLATGGAMHILG
jgi:hypothetical protein